MSKYNKYFALLLVFLNANTIQASINQSQKEVSLVSPYSYQNNYNYQSSGDAFLAQNRIIIQTNQENRLIKPKVFKAWVTAYSSVPEQTDDTPHITASGNYVRDGVVATNFLPFGTKFRLPDEFGDQVFTVEDRMHPRFQDRIDIWFADKYDAKKFGKKWSLIEML
ncbi:MAG: hypothetical protein AAB596_00055 [Patescibacteria group bacterium]